MAKHVCTKCKKKYDYDSFYGICPKCGTFNRKEKTQTDLVGNAVHAELQIQYDEGYRYDQCVTKPREQVPLNESEEKRKKRKRLLIFAVGGLCLILLFEAVQSVRFVLREETFQKNSNYEPVEYAAGERIWIENGSMEVIDAVEVVSENTNDILMPDEKLIGVYIRYLPPEEAKEKENFFQAPMIKCANGSYQISVPKNLIVNYASELGISGKQIIDTLYKFYPWDEVEGYVMFLVNKEETKIDVFLPESNEIRGRSAVQKMHKVTVPIEEGGMRDVSKQ